MGAPQCEPSCVLVEYISLRVWDYVNHVWKLPLIVKVHLVYEYL